MLGPGPPVSTPTARSALAPPPAPAWRARQLRRWVVIPDLRYERPHNSHLPPDVVLGIFGRLRVCCPRCIPLPVHPRPGCARPHFSIRRGGGIPALGRPRRDCRPRPARPEPAYGLRLPAYRLMRLGAATKAGANTRDTMAISLSRMLRLGPEVSLKGSPTTSPSTAALWASEPLPP